MSRNIQTGKETVFISTIPVRSSSVLGNVDVSQLLGPILPHEHILVDFSRGRLSPPRGLDWISDLNLTIENLGKIRRYPLVQLLCDDIEHSTKYSVPANLIMDNVSEMKKELDYFKSVGGATICDLSCTGIRCKPYQPQKLVQLSQQTGLNIIHATGFYCHKFLPDNVHTMRVEDMKRFMLQEVSGVGSDVKCGIIYIGCSWPLHSTEERALRAAVAIQKAEGIPITVHPGRNEVAPFQILDILESEGGDISCVCITHNDRTFNDSNISKLQELAARNCYINISLFGKECSHYQYDLNVDMPSDAQRIDMINRLLQSGHRDKILISHDVVCKHELQMYGGHGYGHLLESVVPKMKERGINEEIITDIMIHNPRQWLNPLPHIL